jgi:hypothetical protein
MHLLAAPLRAPLKLDRPPLTLLALESSQPSREAPDVLTQDF